MKLVCNLMWEEEKNSRTKDEDFVYVKETKRLKTSVVWERRKRDQLKIKKRVEIEV